MNRFELHHQDSIRFGYSCFDRIICNGSLPQFRHSKRSGTIRWFLRTQRQAQHVNRAYLAKIARDYHDWLNGYAQKQGTDIVDLKESTDLNTDIRREQWVEPYFQQLGSRPGLAVILKAREAERIVVHFAGSNEIAVQRRFVNLYYFYLQDARCGRMFIRICPYFPFNIRVWMNGHNWLACRLQEENIPFEKRDNLLVACANPARLQELSDAFAPEDIHQPIEAWLAHLLPFFTPADRQQGYRHQLFMAQMEYCHNLLFHKRAALDRLFERLMDARTLGSPEKLAIVFGRSAFRPDTSTGQTLLKITAERFPVIRSSFKNTSIKGYVRDGIGLRTESTCHQLADLHILKNISHLPRLREVLATANDRYLQVQQDVLASYVDRGQLQELRQPTITASGRRVPGLRLDDPRLLALLQAITCFAYLAGKGCFRTADLLLDAQKALGNPQYTLNQLRYDLGKLRGKGLVMRLPGTQSYQVTEDGYRIAIFFLKLYHRFCAPLTAAIRDPVPADNQVLNSRQTRLDRLYVAVDKALQKLADQLDFAA
jgi:hypothetical protein